MTIADGGAVNSLSVSLNDTATVTGAGSQLNSGTAWIYVGITKPSTLTIQNGGVVNSGGADCGQTVSCNILVTGAGSQWNSPFVIRSSGNLSISNGGAVNSPTLAGFTSGDGAIAVDGAGSQLNVAGGLRIGSKTGPGTLTIWGGGAVTSGAVDVGLYVNGKGNVKVIDAGSQWNSSSATVGAPYGSTGNVLIDGARWNNAGSLLIGYGTTGTGVVTVRNNGHLASGPTIIGRTGSLIIDPAVVELFGNFTLQTGGLLSLDIAGVTPDLISRVNISGFGLFQGTIRFDFVDGFAPRIGQSFDLFSILGGADFSGASFQIAGLKPGFQYVDTFTNGIFRLTALNDGVSDSPVPEPSFSWILAGLGLLIALHSLGTLQKGERKNVRRSSRDSC